MASSIRIARQLRALLALTQAEAQATRLRQEQARTDSVAARLERDAADADRRSDEIVAELRRVGGVADALSPLTGRVVALVRNTALQTGPFSEQLLDDLALHHRVRDRALYLRALARAAESVRVERLADRLTAAADASIDWITTLLAEDALDGPAALRPTALQLVVGNAGRVLALPARLARDEVDRWSRRIAEGGEEVRTTVRHNAARVVRFADDARDVVVTGRDAALDRAEALSRREGAVDTSEALHDARTRLGTLRESELPISDYDSLGADDAAAAVRDLGAVSDVNAVLAYEEANKDRRTVVSAAQSRHAELAREVVGVG